MNFTAVGYSLVHRNAPETTSSSSDEEWCDPVAVASSTGLSVKKPATKDSAVESNCGCSSKSNKTTIATLLRKRLQQEEEHEENKKKRHQERMEMDAKFLKVLEKLAEK